MNKWYNDPRCNSDVVIGGQVCLVRNVAKYPFEAKMNPEQQAVLLAEVYTAVRLEEDRLGIYFEMRDLSGMNNEERTALIGRLAIPPLMLGTSGQPGLLTTADESVSILINGTEHICIQVSCPGRNIQEALNEARMVDDAINMHIPYAFSDKYGYLTASPLYTGTGMSASYLLHLPYLEKDQITKKYSKELGQLGFTLRGHFHGGTQVPADVFRLKNSKTLGLSEEEIISALEHLTGRISRQERNVHDRRSGDISDLETDQIYRAYGLLRYARDLDYEETLDYLSCLRTGYLYGILTDVKLPDIFSMMIGVQDAVLKEEQPGEMKAGERRALYMRRHIPQMQEN